MKRSRDRILTTHAGSLQRPDDLRQMLNAIGNREAYDEGAFAERLRGAVAEVVRNQAANGMDFINDGEQSKFSWTTYARERLSGHEQRDLRPGEEPTRIFSADMRDFPEYFARQTAGSNQRPVFCTGPLKYIGQVAIQTDIANLKAALQGVKHEEAVLTAVAPGTIEHWMRNQHYATQEDFLFAIADAMHDEYKAITDAGFVLQIDDPDMADAYQIAYPISIEEYRRHAAVRVEALNQALREVPEEQVRFHVCWGSYKGPHVYDIELQHIIDLIYEVKAQAYSIEQSNPRHEHEWHVFETHKLPDGKILVPGVVGHACDFIEHPRLVADRLIQYAKLVGRENVQAGTDCGLGTRVGHPKIGWAKFRAMADGAALATKELWTR